jgi:hypothetical protein
MQPYQERVVVELKELHKKIDKLILFIEGEQFKNLDVIDKSFLKQQLDAMMEYRKILVKRVDRFYE